MADLLILQSTTLSRPTESLVRALGEQAMLHKLGRPKSDKPKELVTVRLDADALVFLRSGGPGWQTRLNALVSAAAKRAKKPKRGAAR